MVEAIGALLFVAGILAVLLLASRAAGS